MRWSISGRKRKGKKNKVKDIKQVYLCNLVSFSIVKKVAKKLVWVKLTLSRLPTNTELIFNKLVLIKFIQNG